MAWNPFWHIWSAWRARRLAHTSTSLDGDLRRLAARPVEVGGIVSLGAGRGDDSAHLLKVWPDADLLLIEMDDRFVPEFERLKRLHPRVNFEVCAAAGEDRDGLMHKTSLFGGAIATGEQEGGTPIAFRKVDTLVRTHGLRPPYLLKFDTHGAELEILSGAEDTLRDTSLIIMEVYNFKLGFMNGRNLTFDEMSLHLREFGFRCVDIFDPLHRPGDHALWQMHMVFIRADHPTFSRSGYSSWAKP